MWKSTDKRVVTGITADGRFLWSRLEIKDGNNGFHDVRLCVSDGANTLVSNTSLNGLVSL